MVVSQGGVRIERSGSIQQVSCILRWSHRLGAQAHCLARLIIGASSTPPVAVLSEIATNPDERGITGDFAAAADAFIEVVASAVGDLDPGGVVWIAHHGPFSSHDPAGPETFTEIALAFDGQHYHDDLTGDRLLTSDDVTRRMGPLGLTPVPEMLADLRHLG
ncbi:MAG: hypothetical protein ACRDSH_14410 [Pseudonocardiaceae bacterium]